MHGQQPRGQQAGSSSPTCRVQEPDLRPGTSDDATASCTLDREAWRYVVEVTTGSCRGAGTPNMATLQLYGQNACSATFRIGDDGDNNDGAGFARNSIKRYAIRAPNLGAVRRVHLKKDVARASEIGSGWFLERVSVTGPEGHVTTFPCHAWVGESDDGAGTGAPPLPACGGPVPTGAAFADGCSS